MPDQAERFRVSPPGDKSIIGLAFALFAVLHATPFLFTRIPPLVDLLGHMGRYAVQENIGSSPQLQQNWSFHWAPVANLGFDVLIQLLSPVMGVERASRLLAALLAPFTIWGLGRVSRAVHGTLSPFLVLAAPFAMAFPFQMGFVNYCLSCALALHLFASWANADKRGWGFGKRLLVFIPGSVVVWSCHAYGWGIFAVMAGGYELVRVAQAPEGRRLAAARDHFARLAAISFPALLLVFWRSGSNGVETKHFFDFALKFSRVAELLRDQVQPVDLLSIGLILGVLLLVLLGRQVRLSRELAVPTALLFMCELLLPFKLLGSVYADLRLWPVIFMVALLAPVPGSVGPGATRLIVVGGQLLGALRARGTKFNSDPSQVITPQPDCDGPLWPEVMQRLPEIPRARFDYLWLVGFDMAQAPKIPDAEPLYADEVSALYRLSAKN